MLKKQLLEDWSAVSIIELHHLHSGLQSIWREQLREDFAQIVGASFDLGEREPCQRACEQ